MAKLTVNGVPGFDGEYPDLDLGRITIDEWRDIKRHTGLRAGEMMDAYEAGDVDGIAALAAIALTRAGKPSAEVWAALGQAEPTSLDFDFTDEEQAEEAVDPPAATPTGSDEPVSATGDDNGSSGGTSSASLALPARDLSRTGTAS
jgi:hypothetical protein